MIKRKPRWKLPWCTVISGLMALSLCQLAFSRPPDEYEFTAAKNLGSDIASWISDLENHPDSIAIFAVHANEPFDPNFSRIIENHITQELYERRISKVTSCVECRTAQVNVDGDNVVITKASPDLQTLKAFGAKIPVESFLVVEVYRTTFALVAEASLYANPGGDLLGAKEFRVSALNMGNSSVQVLLTFGSGRAVGGNTGTTPSLTSAANVFLLEELGFAKGGLNLGTIFGGNQTLFYLNPTLSLRGKFGSYSMGWSLNLGVGYGFEGASQGFTTRVSYEIYLGSFVDLGLEGAYFFPSGSQLNGAPAYAGLHIGISFGR